MPKAPTINSWQGDTRFVRLRSRRGSTPRERLLPEGTEVSLVSEKVEKYGRTLGRLLRRDGRDISQEVLKVSHAVVLESPALKLRPDLPVLGTRRSSCCLRSKELSRNVAILWAFAQRVRCERGTRCSTMSRATFHRLSNGKRTSHGRHKIRAIGTSDSGASRSR